MAVRVRPYHAQDAAAVARFFAAVHDADETVTAVSGDAWETMLAHPAYAGGRDVLVADDDVGMAGLAFAARLEGDAEAGGRRFRIVVHPRVRRRGLGSELLRALAAQEPGGILVSLVPARWE